MGVFNKFCRKDLLQIPFVCSLKENHTPTENQLFVLFQVESKSWEYVDSIGLDIRNGDPYFMHDVVRNVGGAYGSELFVTKIDYDTVRKYSSEKTYGNLNETTWQNFVPKEKIQAKSNCDAVSINASCINANNRNLQQFYYEFHNIHAHDIVFLRKTCSGFRLFYVESQGWNGGLPFTFNKSEQMIQKILTSTKYGYDFNAYDRLLSEIEIAYLQSLANEKGFDTIIDFPERVKSFQKWKHIKTKEKSEKWMRLANLSKRLAESGSNYSLK